jgi:hypothetical protein
MGDVVFLCTRMRVIWEFQALFPSGSEEDYSRSQQSIEQIVGIRTCFYVINIFKNTADLFYVCYEF